MQYFLLFIETTVGRLLASQYNTMKKIAIADKKLQFSFLSKYVVNRHIVFANIAKLFRYTGKNSRFKLRSVVVAACKKPKYWSVQ